MIASVVIGPAGHGVVRLAESTAAGQTVRAETAATLRLPDCEAAHLHFTDRLFGERCEESAERFCTIVRALDCPVVVTLHDVPMPAQGAELYARRSAAYRRVTSAAAATIVSSVHEARLLEATGSQPRGLHVLPLPIDAVTGLASAGLSDEVGVLGWIYPGKGHDAVLEALPPRVRLVAFGAASPGHEELLNELESSVWFHATGFLGDADLLSQLSRVGVPVAPGTMISASASIGSWLEAGRRPIVIDGPWVRELEERCPGALTITEPRQLGRAIAEALERPESTLLGRVAVGPSRSEIAAKIRQVCLDVAG